MSEIERPKWLVFEFFCVRGKTEEALEILHNLGKGKTIFDNSIRSVVARWTEIISGDTLEVEKTGTMISGVCLDSQERPIAEALFKLGVVETGQDYYLHRIHFLDPSTKRRIGVRVY